ncbi:MAG: site-specific integrase, partial [Candidatus Eremiobacteraeota bacterium]|nr:site-specific integrase [Candidatus Eremiobacteraeota bacterium]
VLNAVQLRRLLEEAKTPSRRSKKRGYLSSYSAFYPAVAFLAFTGARRGEALAVKWKGLDLEDRAVTISESLGQTKADGLFFKTPKNGKIRTICLPQNLVNILRTHKARQAAEKLELGSQYQDADLVFAKPDGTPIPPWNFGASFAALVGRLGIPRIRLHDLRDTHASLLAKEGVGIEVVSKRLGHSGIAITVDRYVKVYRDRDAAAASTFDRLVG